MLRAQRFTFHSFNLDRRTSTLTNNYVVFLPNTGEIHYADRLEFPGVCEDMWDRIPIGVLESLLQALHLVLGINYWKLHLPHEILIERFALTKSQANFWNVLYTKGLAEFFYRLGVDFRGLVRFPYGAKELPPAEEVSLTFRALLALGGGKDSIVAAEMLSKAKIPFDIFAHNPVKMHEAVARSMRRNLIFVKRSRAPNAIRLEREHNLPKVFPAIATVTVVASLAALLRNYRFVVLANERSADFPNTTYLGLDVNHQWSKSSEAEAMIRDYISRYITPSCVSFSFIRPYTEVEMVRRFITYPQYFYSFTSCNKNFSLAEAGAANVRPGRAYWCNRCPKCVFMFTCMTAYLPKEIVVDIFGENLHAKPQLLKTYKELLGLEGHKPFECVGTAEEMIVAMHKTAETKTYDADPAIEMFMQHFPLVALEIARMEKRVLGPQQTLCRIPPEFVGLDRVDS